MKTMTVREVTTHIKDLLENDYKLANLWVKGEISNFKRAASGHIYLTLKDEYSSVRVVMFRSRASRLVFEPENGMDVRVRGYISIYERSGQYQLYAQEIEPSGYGALYAAFEQLKEKLRQEGLFDDALKKEIPGYPSRVGLITSPYGAAVRDMINILRRRWPGIEIILAPVKVQGDKAGGEICSALKFMNLLRDVDLIIVGRGGGALEELWAFNTEEVSRGIAVSEIPVISAVGHETDFTIADMVADLRAPTPSAAAEFAVPDKIEMYRYIQSLHSRMNRNIAEKFRELRIRLQNCQRSRVFKHPADVICGQRRQTVDWLQKHMLTHISQKTAADRRRLEGSAGRLEALSPLSTLARGYSICMTGDGSVIRKSSSVKEGEYVNIRLHKGFLRCQVYENDRKD
ncbi:MAG: exodeoxyribonuclease VII large subunit [Clostridiales bacterium]|nr:exodeoxyribonuclease VII large subunit [Clostridiales bacterium]MCF8021182.1 exodeoxyribonuclease VII large subunit [Clostridiales bacterium]